MALEVMLKLRSILLLAVSICSQFNTSSELVFLADSELVFQPHQKSYVEGEEVTIICQDQAYSGNCTWLQDDQIVDLEIDPRIQINKTNSCVFTIFPLTSDDESWWSCQYANGFSGTRRLIIESKKIVQLIPDEPKVIHAQEGATADLECLFNHSAPYCFWTKDDNVLVISGRYRYIGNKNEGNCTIRLRRINYKDFGTWRCSYPITNNAPALKSFDITLNITVMPTLPFITVNNLHVENEKTIFVNTRAEYNSNNNWVSLISFNNLIGCWTLNGYPEAKLEWTMEDESGNKLEYLEQVNQLLIYDVSTSSNLKTTYLPLQISDDSVYQRIVGVRKFKLICSAFHPSFKDIKKTASVCLMWGHHEKLIA